MKIYTRSGDAGTTGLFGGPRVTKDDSRIEAYGTVDELNAVLGTVRATQLEAELDGVIETIQHELFAIGAELASPDPDRHQLRSIGHAQVAQLESWIDQFEGELPQLKNFILPAGTPAACQLHVARAVCRRAERRVVRLAQEQPSSISADLIIYLNRLSDLLFVLSRISNQRAGVRDAAWRRVDGDSAADR